MDSLARTLDAAIKSNDYATLARVFSDRGTSSSPSWSSVGQGEQRALAAHFIRTAVASTTFLPAAFASSEMMGVMTTVLGHLPSTVEGAADNILRQKLFDYKVHQEEDFSGAARILAGMRMDDDPSSVYCTSPAEKCDGELQSSVQAFKKRPLTLSYFYPGSLRENCRMFLGGESIRSLRVPYER
jgi:hypothetical protein